jgi:hypothetical protein
MVPKTNPEMTPSRTLDMRLLQTAFEFGASK